MEYVAFNFWLILHRAFEGSDIRKVSVKMSHMSDILLQRKREKETVMKTVFSVSGDANKI